MEGSILQRPYRLPLYRTIFSHIMESASTAISGLFAAFVMAAASAANGRSAHYDYVAGRADR
jgi:hypothetical protein